MSEGPELTLSEAARYLGIGEAKLYQLLTDKQIHAVRKGTAWSIARQDLDEWMQAAVGQFNLTQAAQKMSLLDEPAPAAAEPEAAPQAPARKKGSLGLFSGAGKKPSNSLGLEPDAAEKFSASPGPKASPAPPEPSRTRKDRLLGLAQAAAFLDKPEEMVQRLARAGLLESIQKKGEMSFALSELEAYVVQEEAAGAESKTQAKSTSRRESGTAKFHYEAGSEKLLMTSSFTPMQEIRIKNPLHERLRDLFNQRYAEGPVAGRATLFEEVYQLILGDADVLSSLADGSFLEVLRMALSEYHMNKHREFFLMVHGIILYIIGGGLQACQLKTDLLHVYQSFIRQFKDLQNHRAAVFATLHFFRQHEAIVQVSFRYIANNTFSCFPDYKALFQR